MIQKIILYLKGYLYISIHGNSVERFINLCRYENIHLWGLISRNNQYEMFISLSDFRRLHDIRQRTRIHIQIIHKIGLPFLLFRYKNQKLFFIGILIFTSFIYVFCNLIWNIQINGNQFYTDETLKNYLMLQNVRPLMNKNNLNCGKIVQLLRTEYPEIVWVSASLSGCYLNIEIKENTERKEKKTLSNPDQFNCQNLIADRNGTIVKMITRAGVPIVHEGDNVKKGDLLVSGQLPILNDSNEIVSYQNQCSDADIYAETTYFYRDEQLNTYNKKIYKRTKNQIGIIFNDSLYSFHQIKQKPKQEIYTRQVICPLLHDVMIPARIFIKTSRSYIEKQVKYNSNDIQKKMSLRFQDYCHSLKEKNIKIISHNVKIHIGKTNSIAEGSIKTIEKIGELKEYHASNP